MDYRFCPHCGRPLILAEVAGRVRPTCFPCGFSQFPDPKVATGVIATRSGRILLQQRRHPPGKGLWSFPGGFVDAGERVEEAALREILDETHVEIRLEGLVGVYSQPGQPVIFIVYHGVILSGEPSPGQESLAVGLFSLEELPPLAFPHDVEVLRHWKERKTSPP
ncbi:MAG: NUDIX hydrolase [Dehalococcoidia bacterium]|nr:NUDIX hydrolase [Dehalococcoidia bacterium]